MRYSQWSDQDFARREEFVHNLCEYIDNFRPGESDFSVLSISFNEKQLFATTADLLAHSGALPVISLEDLLNADSFVSRLPEVRSALEIRPSWRCHLLAAFSISFKAHGSNNHGQQNPFTFFIKARLPKYSKSITHTYATFLWRRTKVWNNQNRT